MTFNKKFSVRHIILGSMAGVLALTLTWSVAEAQGQKGKGGPPWAQALKERFPATMAKDKSSVKIGKKGKKQREFGIKGKRTKDSVELTLTEKGGKGGESQFAYDAKKGIINISQGGKSLKIEIRKNKVKVGNKMCNGGDAQCISKAVKAALKGLSAEEAAAAMLVLGDGIRELKYGHSIQATMYALTAGKN